MPILEGMKITDALLGEHALFYQLFDALDDVLDQAATTGEILRAFDVLRAAVLSHATLEDEALFSHVGRGDAGIISIMRAEHREIETIAMGITRAKTIDEARSGGRALLDLLRDHFHREEEVLFPLCEHALEPARLEEMGERYKAERGLA